MRNVSSGFFVSLSNKKIGLGRALVGGCVRIVDAKKHNL